MAEADSDAGALSVSDLHARITDHKAKLSRISQESKDLQHEKVFLQKTLELKRGQRTMQDGQVKLSQAELEDKAKEIAMYKREAPRTLLKYNELVRQQRQMQDTLNRLHHETEQLSSSKNVFMSKIQNLNVEDLVERHARGLPDTMAGALRKSAAALVPFFDYLLIAADTNNRLVDHVSAEIDKYTHVNISASPFMSGILFYCVLLVPLLTLISFGRRIFDSSSKLTVSHYIIFGNIYFVIICVINVIASFILHEDPVSLLFKHYERPFIVANLFLATYYVWHVLMLGVQSVYTVEKRNISQFLATVSVGVHYFLFAWRRVFTDSEPLMYTFNYVIYATIFSFILYERFNRMTTRQLNENQIFRFIQMMIRRLPDSPSQLFNLKGLHNYVTSFLTSMLLSPTPARRFSRRHDRVLVDKHRYKTKERPHSKYKYSNSESDQDANDIQVRKRSDGTSSSRGRSSKKDSRSPKKPEGRGFISIFFGSKENENDSSEDDNMPSYRSSWGFMRRGVEAK